ncbi:unnamed protein product [Brassica rapa]|uniref:Uncharacterized protein n=2 Tax=Brassica TaxID=3705 RepID=A0A8D9DH41_BRACM|nr:unnamed protein product [Brassica napus]CAG7873248.1 unnamed protein product [Brassica rapa]
MSVCSPSLLSHTLLSKVLSLCFIHLNINLFCIFKLTQTSL